MISGTNNTLSNSKQYRTIRNTAPGTFLSRVCMFTIVSVFAAALVCGTAGAATITVCSSGCDYTTIQAAVDAVGVGDTIIVGDGMYNENMDVDKRLTIRYENRAALTTVENAIMGGMAGMYLNGTDHRNTWNNNRSNTAIADATLFTEISTEIIGTNGVTWGDYDNDGDLDILLSGGLSAYYGPAKVYRNDGNDTFIDINAGLPSSIAYGFGTWADYDNDDDLDILLTAIGDPYSSNIYRNDAGNFTDINADIIGVYIASADWGDYDNDGDLDLFIQGMHYDGSEYVNVAKIYRNDDGTFVDLDAGINGARQGSCAWGDYDNDGDLDLLVVGGEFLATIIYRNDNGTFVDIGAGLPAGWDGSVAWGDYDNDGDIDILFAESRYSSSVGVYQNNAGNFSLASTVSDQGRCSSAEWGDFDNDGDLDIAVIGTNNTLYYSSPKVFRNDGGTFIEEVNTGFPIMYHNGFTNSVNALSWGDYDNDGDLDLLITGDDGSGLKTKLFRNDINNVNNKPQSPTDLASYCGNDSVTLSWTASTDDNTPTEGLNYNIRIGTSSSGNDILSDHSNNNGYRKIISIGNAQQNTNWAIQDLEEGVYYWSVQAIDGGFVGSEFATDQIFYYPDLCILLFPFEVDDEGTTPDASGNGNDGIVYGAVFTTGQGIRNNNAYQFNRSSGDNIQVPFQESQTATDALTLEAWIYPTAWDNIYAGYNRIVSKQPVYLLRGASNGRAHFQILTENYGYQGVMDSAVMALNQWHYVVGTFDGRYLKLYVDGVLKGTTELPEEDVIVTNEAPIFIGESSGLAEGFTGIIDDVAIYGRAKKQSEIENTYNSTMIIYVPDDYAKIQWAVDNASTGSTIIVRDGVYTENVDVNKRLTIRSDNGSTSTIVQADNPANHAFNVTADSVTISGFTVKDASSYKSGIYLDGVQHNNISNNNVSNNRYGIHLENSDNNTLERNNASGNTYGIYLSSSGNNTLSNNTMSNNEFNFGANCFCVPNDIDIGNTVNGKPIYYLVNVSDIIIDPSSNAGTIYCINCQNISIKDLNLLNNRYGVYLGCTRDSNLYNNTISNNDCGIVLHSSSNNTLEVNTVSHNIGGIGLDSSSNNVLKGNTVKNINCGGISLGYSDNNTVSNNTASCTHQGITLHQSNNNTIANNSASNSGQGIRLDGSHNNIVTNNTALDNGDDGIFLWACAYNTVSNNDANSNGRSGIFLSESGINMVSNNTANSNVYYGIILYRVSNENTVVNNNVSNNSQYGIYFWCSLNNELNANVITDNAGYGIYLVKDGYGGSDNNLIYNNYFDNTNNVYDDSNNTGNIWNTTKTAGTNIIGGPYLGGNYWSDYSGEDTDGDGLGDTLLQYNSSGNIHNGGDWLPLVEHVPDIGHWMETTPLPQPTCTPWWAGKQLIIQNGHIYVFGGQNTTDNRLVTVYYSAINSDGTVGPWLETTPLPEKYFDQVVVTVGDHVYLITGANGDVAVYYAPLNTDGSVGEWTATEPLHPSRQNFASVSYGEYIYVSGGNSGGIRDFVKFTSVNPDGSLNHWADTTPLPEVMQGHTMVVNNGYLYVMAPNSAVYYASINSSDGTVGNWTVTTPLPQPMNRYSAFAHNGYLYLLGGDTEAAYYTQIMADGSLGDWQATTSLPAQRMGLWTGTHGSYVYAAGGFNGSSWQDAVYYAAFVREMCGDLNRDGSITPADAAIALRLAASGSASWDPTTLAAADVSGDGSVTSLDALMILQAAGGMIEL